MRQILTVLMVAGSLLLSACGPMLSAVNSATGNESIAGSTRIDDQAMFDAEALYNVPADAYTRLRDRGQLPDNVRQRVRPILLRMADVLDAVRTAYRLGNATTFNDRVAELRRLSDQAKGILGVR